MPGYYDERLAAERLRACYECAPPRVKAYLEAEIEYVLDRIPPGSRVLELGCGYGRVLGRLAARAGAAVGIDTSLASLVMARRDLASSSNVRIAAMDAVATGFRRGAFDLTACIQNGISAFHVDQRGLIAEAVRVTRSGGRVLFSSYAGRFWSDRLEWFEVQAERGLIGPIDHDATGNGVIVCKDGFRATTVGSEDFRRLAASLGLAAAITEVDGSSLFCEITVDR